MARLTLGSGAEHSGDVIVALNVRNLCKVQVTAVGLALASEGFLEILFSLGALKRHNWGLPLFHFSKPAAPANDLLKKVCTSGGKCSFPGMEFFSAPDRGYIGSKEDRVNTLE